MEPREFQDSPAGILVPTIANQWAFVPNPLPPEIDLGRLVLPLAEAMLAIGELNAAGRKLANPDLVIRPLQRKEALQSSSMEGTYTTADALALAEIEEGSISDPATIEVRNYIKAIDKAERLLNELPISNRFVREIHHELLAGVGHDRGYGKQPGAFKTDQNFIGGRNRRLEDARFVPPPPAEAETAMSALEQYINRESSPFPPVVDAALIHYQFETIHPFADGNGRVGRILIPVYLMQAGLLSLPLLYVSPVAEGRKDDYVDQMLNVSRRGEWEAWITFFLELITESCRATSLTINKLEDLRERYLGLISEGRMSARLMTVVDSLFVSPILTIPRVVDLLGVTYPAAKNLVEKLMVLGIVEELHSGTRGAGGEQNSGLPYHPRRFVCRPIIALSEGRP